MSITLEDYIIDKITGTLSEEELTHKDIFEKMLEEKENKTLEEDYKLIINGIKIFGTKTEEEKYGKSKITEMAEKMYERNKRKLRMFEPIGSFASHLKVLDINKNIKNSFPKDKIRLAADDKERYIANIQKINYNDIEFKIVYEDEKVKIKIKDYDKIKCELGRVGFLYKCNDIEEKIYINIQNGEAILDVVSEEDGIVNEDIKIYIIME